MDRNTRLYPLYAMLFNAFFWMPVFFLYFASGLPLARVLQLEAIYYAAVVLLEVPSGYFSDSVGRRPTLLISAAALALAYALFTFGGGFTWLVIAQVLLAAGIAFNSGTDTSLHFDSLAAIGREDEYGAREATVGRRAFLASAAAAVVGGAVGLIDLRLAYALSFIAAAASIFVVAAFREPPRVAAGKTVGNAGNDGASGVRSKGAETQGEQSRYARPTFVSQLRGTLGELRRPSLAWLTAYMVLMIVLNHVPYEFYQPYLRLLTEAGKGEGPALVGGLLRPDRLSSLPFSPRGGNGLAPLITGLHAAVAMLIGSWVAGRSIRMRDRFGTAGTLLTATLLQGAIIAALGIVLSPVIALFAVLRGAPRALMAAPFNAAVAPRVTQARRATFLSLQSLAGRLAFSVTLLVLSTIEPSGLFLSTVGPSGEPTWAVLAPRLQAAAIIAAVGFSIMWATRGALAESASEGPARQ